MAGRPLSEAAKRHLRALRKTKALNRALKAYRHEQAHPTGPKGRPRGYRWFTDKKAGVYMETLRRMDKGGRTAAAFAKERTILFHEEEEELIRWVVGQADRARPPSHKKILTMANRILQSRVPGAELGNNWLDRLLTRHRDQLQTHWSSNLDTQRADGLNPIAVKQYFDMVITIYNEHEVKDCNKWAADESGFLGGEGGKERVVGRRGTKTQHIRQEGVRETTTVMAAICAAGPCLPPFVIFKGERFQIEWGMSNPGNAL